MEIVEKHSFKNEASKRFHDYFQALVKSSAEEKKAVFDAFGLTGLKNPTQFFSKIKSGASGVTIEHIYIAKEKFNLNPGYLFEVSNQIQLGFDQVLISNDTVEYQTPNDDSLRVGKALKEILRRHGTRIKGYAENRLSMSEQALHKIFKGQTAPSWFVISRICEDHGESLEQLRSGPMPEGHYLAKIKMLEERVVEQKELIKVLQEQKSIPGKVKRASA
ncbi:hypothetical protein [Sediminibacterium sp.]|uniref:hypothetical protein n=1 Tax=Sediminibacterium sp. TaxID=1917865 RepID=UPI003F6A05A0